MNEEMQTENSEEARNQEDELQQRLAAPWSIHVRGDGSGEYLAWVPELPACTGAGTSRAQAVSKVEDALRELLTFATAEGREIGQPRPLELHYSGRFQVRVPKSVHRALAFRAEAEDCSLNQVVNALIVSALAREP